MPQQLQSTSLSDVTAAHQMLKKNLNQAYVTFTGDWNLNHDLDQFKQSVKATSGIKFVPIEKGVNAYLKQSGQSVKIVDYIQDTNSYSLDINGTMHTVDSHLLTTNNVSQYEWISKTPPEEFQSRSLNNIATATVMYAVSFPKKQLNEMKFVINMFSDSMSGWTMQKVRWEECEQCYGINGQVVSTNMKSPPLAIMIGTVGSEALERAKVDIQNTIHDHAGKITQEQLDMAFDRMAGEMTVKGDYTDDIHGFVHADLVSGNNPSLQITKPSLKAVNEASMYLTHMAKIEVVPTEVISSAKAYKPTTAGAYDSDSDSACEMDMKLENLRF